MPGIEIGPGISIGGGIGVGSGTGGGGGGGTAVWSTSAFSGSDYEYTDCVIYQTSPGNAELEFTISGPDELVLLAYSVGTVFTVANATGITPGDTITLTSVVNTGGGVIVNGSYVGGGYSGGASIGRFNVVYP